MTTTTANGHANGKVAILGDQHRRPPTTPVDPGSVHDGMKFLDRWVGWRWTWNEQRQKWDKPPVNAATGGPGSSTNPATWSRFDEALHGATAGRYDGVGFVLGAADGGIDFAGIDLDDCRNPVTGELSALAQDIIATINSYTEVSPSGTGVKILCVGTLPRGARTKNKSGTVEIYGGGRYFTITGQRVDGTPKRVEERHAHLAGVWEKYIGTEQAERNGRAASGTGASSPALAAMLRHKPADGEQDGSKRLFLVCCRAVEHDLSDEDAIAMIRLYEQRHPFPAAWTDDDVVRRLRDAERQAERGAAIAGTLPEIANYTIERVEDESGETREVASPLSMSAIIADVNRITDGWPRRVDNVLFVDDPEHSLSYFDTDKTPGLFGWLRRVASVKWNRGGNFVGQSELFAELRRTRLKGAAQ